MNKFKFRGKYKHNYFEGWYIRILDTTNNINYAFIFGITSYNKDPHSFIQIFDGNKEINRYVRFHTHEFSFDEDFVKISSNYLSQKKLKIEVEDFLIDISLFNLVEVSKNSFNKSVMSYLYYLPLECFQEVLFLDANFKGIIKKNNTKISISGKSYMEKTYGKKFPSEWVWIQCNNFDKKNIHMSLSYGKIPVLFFKVKGFFVLINDGFQQYLFSVYKGGKFKIIKRTQEYTKILIKQCKYKLFIRLYIRNQVKLVGPNEKSEMNLSVYESLNSNINIKLYKKNKLILKSKGTFVGCENML